MGSEIMFSEIAKFLASDEIHGSQKIREKAGLLALINLLGILETFYDLRDETIVEQSIKAIEDKSRQATTSSRDAVTSLISGIAKPQVEKSENMDSNILNALGTMISSLMSQKSQGETKSEAGNRDPKETPEKPQFPTGLLLDPKFLTAVLKLLASLDFGKSKPGESKQEDTQQLETPVPDGSGVTEPYLTDNSKETAIPQRGTDRRAGEPGKQGAYHKPGFAIKKHFGGPAKTKTTA